MFALVGDRVGTNKFLANFTTADNKNILLHAYVFQQRVQKLSLNLVTLSIKLVLADLLIEFLSAYLID